jgi:sulfide:quinone oxidoreductase
MERRVPQPDLKPRVAIVGGGVAGVEAMLALRDLSGDRAEIELYAPRREFLYRPLAVTEPFGRGRVLQFDLQRLTERCGASFCLNSVASVDTDRRHITTRDGVEVAYDYLVVASGTRMLWAVPGAVTFWGVPDEGGAANVVRDLEAGALRKVIFTMPGGSGWPLPAYELALLSASQLARTGDRGAELMVVTPEDAPLQLFGVRASDQMGQLLAERGIKVITGAHPIKFEGGRLLIAPGDPIEADAVVSTPRLEGRTIEGLPSDVDGFIPVDAHGRVPGLERVFAIGDVTAFPVKQGGIATQLADAAAEAIASQIGSPVEPRPFEPILRGVLLTGEAPQYLYGKLSGGHGETSTFSDRPPWSDQGKIVGKYLAPFLSAVSDATLQILPSPPGVPLVS